MISDIAAYRIPSEPEESSHSYNLRPHQASLPYWFQGNSAAMCVLIYWLRGFLLSTFANRFELRCEPKQMMLLYYKSANFGEIRYHANKYLCSSSGIFDHNFL